MKHPHNPSVTPPSRRSKSAPQQPGRRRFFTIIALCLLAAGPLAGAAEDKEKKGDTMGKNPAPAPLFRCPVYDCAKDAEFIWNRKEQCWWITYLQARSNSPAENEPGTQSHFLTDLGLVSTPDRGRTWVYRGVMRALRKDDPNWGYYRRPQVEFWEGRYHGFFSKGIQHYVSDDLIHWEKCTSPSFKVEGYDAGAYRLPDGRYVVFSAKTAIVSKDLKQWEPLPGEVRSMGEGPHVCSWKGFTWMNCEWGKVARSEDGGLTFNHKMPDLFLKVKGSRPMDVASVPHQGPTLPRGDRAYVLYFAQFTVGFGKPVAWNETVIHCRNNLQVAEVTFDPEKKTLVCDRNKPFEFLLVPPEGVECDPAKAPPPVWHIATEDIRQICLAEVIRHHPKWAQPKDWRPYEKGATHFVSCDREKRGETVVYKAHFKSKAADGAELEYRFVVHATTGEILDMTDRDGKKIAPKQWLLPEPWVPC